VKNDSEIELNADNSRVYRPREGRPKQCRIRWKAAEYALNWGTQTFPGPHMLVLDPGGSYGVELEVFFSTHKPIAERPHHYFKAVKVRALRLTEPIHLRTQIRGSTEMLALVPPGAYIVQNPTGEVYSMTADEFELRYELDE